MLGMIKFLLLLKMMLHKTVIRVHIYICRHFMLFLKKEWLNPASPQMVDSLSTRDRESCHSTQSPSHPISLREPSRPFSSPSVPSPRHSASLTSVSVNLICLFIRLIL